MSQSTIPVPFRSPPESRLPSPSLCSAPSMQTETQDGSTQCMHCRLTNADAAPPAMGVERCRVFTTLRVVQSSSLGSPSHGRPLDSLQAATQPPQPTQRVES